MPWRTILWCLGMAALLVALAAAEAFHPYAG